MFGFECLSESIFLRVTMFGVRGWFFRGNAVCGDGIETQVTLAGEVRMLRIAVQDVSR
jgi:hypothetical protein